MKPGYGTTYQRARVALLADSPTCAYCSKRPATEADHEPPLSAFAHPDEWIGVLVASCRTCNRRKGGHDKRSTPEPSRQW